MRMAGEWIWHLRVTWDDMAWDDDLCVCGCGTVAVEISPFGGVWTCARALVARCGDLCVRRWSAVSDHPGARRRVRAERGDHAPIPLVLVWAVAVMV